MNSPLKCAKCGKTKQHERLFRLSPSIGGETTGRMIIICLGCLKLADKRKFEEIENLVSKKVGFCSIHKEKKDTYIINKEKKWGGYCFFCEKEKWVNSLQRFNINPLSVTKYFYENWKVTEAVIMQRMIYFAYLELVEKENIILFEEKFQAWEGGPVLESVIYPMYENCKDLESFFAKIEAIDNSLVIKYLDQIANKYCKLKSSQTYKEACNNLWEEAQQNLTNEGENKPIEEGNIFAFIKQNKGQTIYSSY